MAGKLSYNNKMITEARVVSGPYIHIDDVITEINNRKDKGTIRDIDFSINYITDDALKILFKSLDNLNVFPMLKILDFSFNHIHSYESIKLFFPLLDRENFMFLNLVDNVAVFENVDFANIEEKYLLKIIFLPEFRTFDIGGIRHQMKDRKPVSHELEIQILNKHIIYYNIFKN
jgi:hypothetical protein